VRGGAETVHRAARAEVEALILGTRGRLRTRHECTNTVGVIREFVIRCVDGCSAPRAETLIVGEETVKTHVGNVLLDFVRAILALRPLERPDTSFSHALRRTAQTQLQLRCTFLNMPHRVE
jgi:hypothetical protein